MCNRFMVAIRLPARGGIPFQRAGKFLQCLQNRIFAKIGKCQSHVIGMMERIFRNGIGFKTANQFFVAHRNCLADPSAGAGCHLEP